MNVLLGFMMVVFLGGIALWRQKLSSRVVILLIICALVSIAYFFGNQI